MKQDIRQEQTADLPLSTATLAHAEDRTKVEERAANRAERPGSDPALGEVDRPPADGGPTLLPPAASRTGKPVQDQLRADAAANRPPVLTARTTDDEKATPLFTEPEAKGFFGRWDALQVGFIDEPRHAVEQADNLVASAMKRLAEIFAEERARLEGQWDRGDNVSTEDLRVAMRRYRSFFRRLLAV